MRGLRRLRRLLPRRVVRMPHRLRLQPRRRPPWGSRRQGRLHSGGNFPRYIICHTKVCQCLNFILTPLGQNDLPENCNKRKTDKFPSKVGGQSFSANRFYGLDINATSPWTILCTRYNIMFLTSFCFTNNFLVRGSKLAWNWAFHWENIHNKVVWL